MNLKTLLIFLCINFLTSCIDGEKSSDTLTEKEVRDFITTYDHAWNSKDTLTIRKMMSDQYIYFSSKGDISRKTPTLEFLRDTAYVIHSATRPEIEVIIENNVATVNSHWIGDLSWKGESIHDNQRCGLTIAKINGVITLISEHCVQISTN
jgi:ketosteroid isomerase-like protein